MWRDLVSPVEVAPRSVFPFLVGVGSGNMAGTTDTLRNLSRGSLSLTLNNQTGQAQRVVYTFTPYVRNANGTIGCGGTPITVDIWVEPDLVITAEDDTICHGGTSAILVSSR